MFTYGTLTLDSEAFTDNFTWKSIKFFEEK